MTEAKTTRPMKSIVLKKSRKAVQLPESYTTRELIAAQKAAGKDTSQVPVFLIQRLCTFDGASLTAGDVLDLPGQDYAQIVGAIFSDDEDGEGND